jgi:hypothetical protein
MILENKNIITPDNWLGLHLKKDNIDIVKLFSTFYGGYLDGDSWRLNSGCKNIKKYPDNKDKFLITGYSGTQYNIFKKNIGTSSYTSTILNEIIEKSKSENIEVFIIDDILKLQELLN